MNNATPPDKKRRAIEVGIAAVITIGILGFLFSQISLADFKLAISYISPAILVLVFGVYAFINVLRAYRFRVLLSHVKIRFLPMFGGVLVCNFVSSIVPAGVGHLSYPALFRRNFGVPLSQGVPILLLARIFDLMTVCFIFLLSVALAQPTRAATAYTIHSISVIALILLILLVSIAALVKFRDRFAVRLQLVIQKLLAKGPEFAKGGVTKVVEGFTAVKVINTRANLTKVLVSSLGIWTCMYSIGFILMRDLNVSLDIATCLTGQSLSLVTIILPIQGVGNFGTFEGTWAAAFFLLGVPLAMAILSGIVIHLIIFIYQAVLGLLGVLITGRRY